MTLKEIVGNEEMQVLLTRGQEQGFLGIEEVAEALQGMDIVQEDAEALYTHIDEMGIELLEEPDAQERRAKLAEEAERPRRVAAKAELSNDVREVVSCSSSSVTSAASRCSPPSRKSSSPSSSRRATSPPSRRWWRATSAWWSRSRRTTATRAWPSST